MAKELSQNLETIASLRRRLDEEVQFIENVSNENKVLLPTINALEDGRVVQFKTFDNHSEALLAKPKAMLCEPAFMPALQERVEVSSCTGSIQILEAKREALLNVNEVDLISTIQDEHVSVLPRKINALEKKILEDRDVAQLVSRLEEELKREQVTSSIF
ncbi:hypothetical protein FRC02_006925 [Tulasnella sp. 418]|nr:hypothetical protein FRC02_006925 [Tulasnella sp. 418]